MPTAPTLDSVKQQFDDWRADPNKARKIPDYLWNNVAALLEHYKISKITSTLRLSSSQLKAHCQQPLLGNKKLINKSIKNASRPINSFVEVALPTINEQSTIEIIRFDGAVLRIKQPDREGLSLLVNLFLG